MVRQQARFRCTLALCIEMSLCSELKERTLGPAATVETQRHLREKFVQLYGSKPVVYRAPGRVNLIGEHTDYNEGFVMPAALDMYTYVAAAPRSDRKLRVFSTNFGESFETSLDKIQPGRTGGWNDYVRGVAGTLESRGHRLKGADLVIVGEVPLGAGLSSSAAIEVATAVAFLGVSNIELERTEIAEICQQAEHRYAEMRCGIMDQFISCHGKAGHALMLDCRSLEFRLVPVPDSVQLVICNSMVKHEHATSGYNTRRAQCEEGVRILKTVLPEIDSLRDVTEEEFETHRGLLSPVVYRRCRHVISENRRVQEAAAALEKNDIREFGRLMGESHRSLRDDYEVSCRELDVLVDMASGMDGVYGARMTGGGFGGCTINLVDSQQARRFEQAISSAYLVQTGIRPQIFLSRASEGAEVLAPESSEQ
jgi:galactokinase